LTADARWTPDHAVADTGLEFSSRAQPAEIRLFSGDDWTFDSAIRRARRLSTSDTVSNEGLDETLSRIKHGFDTAGKPAKAGAADRTRRAGNAAALGEDPQTAAAFDRLDITPNDWNNTGPINSGSWLARAATLLAIWLGTVAIVGGLILLGRSFVAGQAHVWQYGVLLAMLGQFVLLLGIVVKLSRLQRTSDTISKQLQLSDLRLRSLSETSLLHRTV